MVVVVIAVVVVLVFAIEIGYVRWASRPAPWPSSYPPSVTITDYGFEWSTPPSVLCDGWSSDEPWVPFIVSPGAQFLLAWKLGCWNNTGSYVIDGIASLTNGFSLVESNVPVRVVGTETAYFNVTLAAPSTAYNGSVVLWITAHAA